MRSQALLKQVIRRELRFRKETLVGTMLNQMKIIQFDQTVGGAPVWVGSVEVGSNRHLHNVVILAGQDGTRRYARVGSTVMLRQNTMGRYDIIGPADRVAGTAVVKTYNMGVAAVVTSGDFGFISYRVPFEWYGAEGNWADGSTPFPYTEIQDADGNPIS